MFLFCFYCFLTNEKREKQNCLQDCIKIVVKISLLLQETIQVQGATTRIDIVKSLQL